MTCPHCQNDAGFVFGTCTRCGWNHLENSFRWVKVTVRELELFTHPEDSQYLIDLYSRHTQRNPKET